MSANHDDHSFKQVRSNMEKRYFVGRDKEIGIFESYLKDISCPKKILNIHATGGMGKSYLLDQYKRISTNYNSRFILINSRDFAHSPQQMMRQIYELLGGNEQEKLDHKACIMHINLLAKDTAVILAFDTYEEMQDLDYWLQNNFISHLDHRVLIIISGRYPLQEHWFISPGWRNLIEDLPLRELTLAQTKEYLNKYNIKDMAQITAIYNLSQGHPLTLSLSASMVNNNHPIRKDLFQETNLFYSLTEQWLKEVKSAALRTTMESIALMRRFDQDILADVLKNKISNDLFKHITSYSFIRLGKRGWMMHDLMRDAISLNLRKRSPKRYNEINQAIAAYYFNQIEGNELHKDQSWLLSEFFYHLEDDMIRAIFYDTAPRHHYDLEYVHGSNADEAKQYLQNLKFTSLYENATFNTQYTEENQPIQLIASKEYKRVESELLTQPDFLHSEHNHFILLKQHGTILGLALVIPIHKNSVDYLTHQPVTRAYFQNLTHEQKTKFYVPMHEPCGWYIRMMDVIDPEDAVARSVILQELLQILFKGKMIIASNPLPFYQQLLKRLGFIEVEGAAHHDYGVNLPAPTQILDIKSMGLENYLKHLASNAGIALNREAHVQFTDLTARENEIAHLILEGATNKTIAEKLFVSEVTVKKHLTNIFSKKQIKNRSQLVKLLMDEIIKNMYR
ncbi:hypothetical protein G4V62_04190 [Bacillaceae bacterium SIJ1]|uniref:helix-turn-helix domain-containing protein n=1 Tax=Litoribacterium kuwaitense TaxID=1398745 RepID=UPI0013EC7ABD|nr:helix-turn-helix transcriptional regulator [Litoribacterium kuwaitense]NGP44189.1 hypothetical protein [Litoribacterium kuwaitense]